MNRKKHKLIDQLSKYKEETLESNKGIINKFRANYDRNYRSGCNLLSGDIAVRFCETETQKQKWQAYVHLTSSLPYRGSVGRQTKIFVECGQHILGMVHLTSPLAQLKVRDEYLNYENKWEQLKGVYNIETCVPIRKYASLLTGKLLVYVVFSNHISKYLENRYGDKVIGYETTSLYGKSSMYNRIPFFEYLGLTEGLSAVYLSDHEWRKIIKEYYEVYPDTQTNRLAPVKFQIVDKLANYYKKIGKEFPYEYKSLSFRRGVYFGYARNVSLEESVEEWRNRWYKMRVRGGYKPLERTEKDNEQLGLWA